MIIRKTERVTRVEPSKDFKVDVIYVTPEFIELSDLYHFSSPAYFSRYVQKYLGVKPTDLRE